MITRLDENNKIVLTQQAYFIREFSTLYRYYEYKLNKPDRCTAAFGILYYMFNFDSEFLSKYEDEKERLKHVKAFVDYGNEITDIKVVREAMVRYKSLMEESQNYAYIVMKKNFKKLRDYASKITLEAPAKKSDGILVDYKEFAAVNSLLPKQEEELREFKEKLLQHMMDSVNIFGGGSLNPFE